MRAATSPTSLAGNPELARIAVAYLEALVPVSAGADLLARGIGLNFDGAAQIAVPGIAISTADFVGEGQPIPVQMAPTSAGANFYAAQACRDRIAHRRDAALAKRRNTCAPRSSSSSTWARARPRVVLAAAAAADQPAGLLHGIAALTPSAGAGKTEVIVDDLQALALAVAGVAGNGEIVLIGSPDAAVALRLRLPQPVDWPVLTSAALPAKTIIAVAANAIVSAVEGTPAKSPPPRSRRFIVRTRRRRSSPTRARSPIRSAALFRPMRSP